jgi:mevalonate kinase
MEFGTTFNSKLLLFGEYGLIYGAQALALPFTKFGGRLAFDADGKHTESTAEIRKFFDHLKSKGAELNLHFPFDLNRFESDLNRGLYFESTIPQQYGLGSSGALVAALFSEYAFPAEMGSNLSPEILKANFAVLESFFHGRSSGLDPLISFLNKPVLIDQDKQVSTIEFDVQKMGMAMALIDTHTTSATGPLVQHFIDLFNLPEFEQAFQNQFIPANNGCIESILAGNRTAFFTHLEQLVRFEVYHFHEMIPVGFHRLVSHAVCGKVYIKLLGSGGGGYLLVIAESDDVLNSWATKREIQYIPLS